MPLDDWQEQALEAAMGERSDGRWASKFVGMSAPRQNGKSQIIVARALAGALLFGEKMIIISAHETDTAREIWKRILDVIDDNPSLAGRITGRMDAINREYISFGQGLDRQEIKLKARRASGSRGFSADCLLLDEAQILGESAWGSIVPTVSARPNPQLWLFGTPPTESDSPFAFSRVRESAMANRARHCWLEWSASPDDDIDDPEVWAKANPAYGVRISHEACADDRSAMSDDQFRRERLGMWDAEQISGVIPPGLWDAAGDVTSEPVDRMALGVEVGPDLQYASVVLAGRRADGDWHVSIDEAAGGIAWVVPHVRGLLDANPGAVRAVVLDEGSPAKALLPEFAKAGVRVYAPTVRELGAGCAWVLNGIVTRSLRHRRQRELTTAALDAGKRPLGDTGMWVWNRKTAVGDITPVQAATLALIGAQVEKPRRPDVGGKSYFKSY